jgi:hypothetical protein
MGVGSMMRRSAYPSGELQVKTSDMVGGGEECRGSQERRDAAATRTCQNGRGNGHVGSRADHENPGRGYAKGGAI